MANRSHIIINNKEQGNVRIDNVAIPAVLATSHVILKVLQSETGSMSGGDHSWLKRRKGL